MAQVTWRADETDALDNITLISGPEHAPSLVTDNGMQAAMWDLSFVREYQLWGLDVALNVGGDVEIAAMMRTTRVTANTVFGLFTHGSGTPNPSNGTDETAYVGNSITENGIAVRSRSNGSDVDVTSESSGMGSEDRVDAPHYRRLRVSDNGDGTVTLRSKAWEVGNTEPGWQVEVTTNELNASGAAGMFVNQDEQHYFYAVTVADSGETVDLSTLDQVSTSPGIPATVLENADGTLSTDTAVTRTITLVSDGTELFTGSQTSDATTGELPEIDLSETAAGVDDVIDDEVILDSPDTPGVVSTTVRRTVSDLGE